MNVFELVLAGLLPTAAIIGAIIYLRRYIPHMIQTAINDIGADITDKLSDPMVKRAMSMMGKKSGEVRADESLRNRVANQMLEGSPVIQRVLEELDITPVEGLKLMNDPLLKPFISRLLQGQLQQQGQGQGYPEQRGVM